MKRNWQGPRTESVRWDESPRSNQIEDDGWYLIRMRGSHRHYRHPTKPGLVTIAGHPGVDIPKGTLNSILKQAQLKKAKGEN